MAGRRYSRQREQIYHCVLRRKDHPTAEMVYQQLKPDCPGLSLGTVYRNLKLLTEEGRLLRLPFAVDRYEANTIPHGHLECKTCGDVIDLDLDAHRIHDLLSCSGSNTNLELFTVIFRGLCNKCSTMHMVRENA